MVETYDVNGNITGRIEYVRDSETNEWMIENKYEVYWSELTTSIGVSQASANFLIYPNPVSDFLNIETGNAEIFSLEIYSFNGQLIFRKNKEGSSMQIDLSSFQKGIYFITVRSRDYVGTEKIIKL